MYLQPKRTGTAYCARIGASWAPGHRQIASPLNWRRC